MVDISVTSEPFTTLVILIIVVSKLAEITLFLVQISASLVSSTMASVISLRSTIDIVGTSVLIRGIEVVERVLIHLVLVEILSSIFVIVAPLLIFEPVILLKFIEVLPLTSVSSTTSSTSSEVLILKTMIEVRIFVEILLILVSISRILHISTLIVPWFVNHATLVLRRFTFQPPIFHFFSGLSLSQVDLLPLNDVFLGI